METAESKEQIDYKKKYEELNIKTADYWYIKMQKERLEKENDTMRTVLSAIGIMYNHYKLEGTKK